jgi:hypothetical protein
MAAGLPARGDSFYLTADIATTISGVTYAPSDIVRSDPGVYTLELALPPGTQVNAIHRMDGAGWLLSFGAPTMLCGTMFDPRDVIRYDGANCITVIDGSAVGIPWGSKVDAITLRGGDYGVPIVSFDVPTTINGPTFQPADLAQYVGVFLPFFDSLSTSPQVPRSSNVTGADLHDGMTILTFDVPTTLGAATYQPGELVYWDGESYGSYWSDTAWPKASRIDGLAFLANPGVVPALRVRKSASPGNLFVDWNPSCSNGAEDYAIYEGRIGDWYGHEILDCHDDGGNRVEEITPSGSNRYFLVVPKNPNSEGSYGRDSDDIPRPASDSPCVEPQVISQCP